MTFYRFRKWSAWALFVVVVFSVLAFGTVETWSEMAVEVSVSAIALAWCVRLALRSEEFAVPWVALAPALVLVVAVVQLGLAATASPYRTAHDGLLWLIYTIFLVLCANVFQDRWIRTGFATARNWFAFVVAIAALLQFYLSPDAIYGLRESPGGNLFGPFVDRNHYAIFIELTLPWAMIEAFRSEDKKVLYFGLCGLLFASVIVSGSRAGMAIVAVEFVCVVAGRLLWKQRSSQGVGFGAVLQRVIGPAVIAVLLIASLISTSAMLRFSTEEVERGLSRLEVGATAWKMFVSKPLLGFGLGSFDAVYPQFAERYDGFRWHHAHNDPAELAMEIGVAGILAQLIVLLWLITRPRSRDVWLGLLVPLGAAWGHSWVEFPLRMPSLVLVALTLVAQAEATEGLRVPRRRTSTLVKARPEESGLETTGAV